LFKITRLGQKVTAILFRGAALECLDRDRDPRSILGLELSLAHIAELAPANHRLDFDVQGRDLLRKLLDAEGRVLVVVRVDVVGLAGRRRAPLQDLARGARGAWRGGGGGGGMGAGARGGGGGGAAAVHALSGAGRGLVAVEGHEAADVLAVDAGEFALVGLLLQLASGVEALEEEGQANEGGDHAEAEQYRQNNVDLHVGIGQ